MENECPVCMTGVDAEQTFCPVCAWEFRIYATGISDDERAMHEKRLDIARRGL